MSVDDFQADVKKWLAKAEHRRYWERVFASEE
jgi:hypothetical protein